MRAHVMFSAIGTAINPRDGTIRSGQRIFVSANPIAATGIYKASTVQGASYMLSAYSKVSFTQFGDALLKRRARIQDQ